MKKSEGIRLLRLISAQRDMLYAVDAFERFKATSDDREKYHHALSMIISYGRPFTENEYLGSLGVDNRQFPDYADDQMNLRHRRMLEIRHRFLAHSSGVGTTVDLVPPGVPNPNTGAVENVWTYVVGRREFLHREYISWLSDIVVDLNKRLLADISRLLPEIGPKLATTNAVTSLGTEADFEWRGPKLRTTP